MKILGIMGSPRIKSNTDLLLEEAFQGARGQQVEVEKIVVDRLKIAPCREYYGCLKDGNCVIRDDMDAIYPKLMAADGIIMASPIFFYGPSAQVKALIDRC
ncbi:MAG: flavodoxin family protein, partial [Dehalococcoidales bacterium]|nr:flavodoxin family protein [Dehalococcoidales bacterium]